MRDPKALALFRSQQVGAEFKVPSRRIFGSGDCPERPVPETQFWRAHGAIGWRRL
jgi:hypothetical protein